MRETDRHTESTKYGGGGGGETYRDGRGVGWGRDRYTEAGGGGGGVGR